MTISNTHKTNIKTLVSAIQENGMEGLIDTATALYRDEVRARLHFRAFAERTDRAKKPLISLDEAIYYSSTFTREHFDRFNHVLSNLGMKVMFAKEIRVIDYGCGQGLATLAFLNHLKGNNCIANKVIDVHLIEPSSITLSLARQFILAMAKHCHIQVNITVHEKMIAAYLKSPIEVEDDMLTLHFLSNVIDVPAFQPSLVCLSRHINAQSGNHIVCAVSSYNSGFATFRNGLRRFEVQDEEFSVNSYRFNSNQCRWKSKFAEGQALFAQIA